MDEYIKREDAIKHLRGACIAKYPLSFSYGIFAAADEISKLPTADVAPKSAFERLQHKYDLAVAEREANVKGFAEELFKAKSEVAREIFEGVDSLLDLACHMIGIEILSFPQYTELKKKYMEGKK